jgi:uncharacterized membrane protein required for colicin V production
MMALSIESLTPGKLPVGWFDFVFAALLVFGLFRGRKNGLTKELIPTLRWIAVVLAAGLGYEFAGQIFYNFSGMGRASSDCLGYVAVAFLVYIVFVPVDGFLKTRLEGSNLFGGTEYYLGALFGLIRSSCIILFFLALMNAPHYTAAEIQAQKNFAAQTFGGGEKGFDGDFFPTFQQVQEGVLKKSLVGPVITDNLGLVLINSVPAGPQKLAANPHKS